MDNLLTTREVANILGVKKLDTVYEYIHTGKLKARKIGGNGRSKRHWRVKQADLEAFINGQSTESSQTETKDNTVSRVSA